jgi:dihydrofolate reductase
MRKLILKMSLSLDGFVARLNGDNTFIFPSMDEKVTEWTVDLLWKAGVHIMGSNTYRDMAAYWPDSSEPFAPPMNEIPKVVFSNTLKYTYWTDSKIAAGELKREIEKLKRQPGKDILAHGGARFAQSLSASGLIDQYCLIVHPVIIGQGLSPFNSFINLKLIDSKIFKSGAVALIYQPDKVSH